MLLQHLGGQIAGRWTRMREDGPGMFVCGLVSDATAAGREALRMMAHEGLRGPSIGFIARDWSPSVGPGTTRGRELREIELREVSLVASPMLPGARFAPLTDGGGVKTAA